MPQCIDVVHAVGQHVKEVGIVPFLHVRSNDLGMLLRLIGKKVNESKNFRWSTVILKILVPSITNSGFHFNSKNLRIKNCASYPRELCDMTNLRDWSRQPEIINKFAYWVLPKLVGTLTTLITINFHVVHGLTFRTHLLSTYEVRNMSERPVIPGKVLPTLRIKEHVPIFV